MVHFGDDSELSDEIGPLSHWHEDRDEEDYDKPIGVHFEPDPEDWYEGTIKHFQDEREEDEE